MLSMTLGLTTFQIKNQEGETLLESMVKKKNGYSMVIQLQIFVEKNLKELILLKILVRKYLNLKVLQCNMLDWNAGKNEI